jgi:hypothetical protein
MWMNGSFPDGSVRSGTLNWPPRSPNLSLVDCHVWCSMKTWCMNTRGKLFPRISDCPWHVNIIAVPLRLHIHRWNKPDCACKLTTNISNSYFKLNIFYGLIILSSPSPCFFKNKVIQVLLYFKFPYNSEKAENRVHVGLPYSDLERPQDLRHKFTRHPVGEYLIIAVPYG